jgi:hypothetical protein
MVGRGLHSYEQVTGRLTYAKAAGHQVGAGAVLGAVFGWIFGLFDLVNLLVSGIALAIYGALIGAVIGLVAHALTAEAAASPPSPACTPTATTCSSTRPTPTEPTSCSSHLTAADPPFSCLGHQIRLVAEAPPVRTPTTHIHPTRATYRHETDVAIANPRLDRLRLLRRPPTTPGVRLAASRPHRPGRRGPPPRIRAPQPIPYTNPPSRYRSAPSGAADASLAGSSTRDSTRSLR